MEERWMLSGHARGWELGRCRVLLGGGGPGRPGDSGMVKVGTLG